MPKYIVRAWVDLMIEANSEAEAKEIANFIIISDEKWNVELNGRSKEIELYDIQIDKVWIKQ